jgi:hypothetical protein
MRWPKMRSDLIDIEVHRHAQTTGAVLVSLDGDSDHAVWLQRYRCEIEDTGKSGVIIVTLPESYASEKGLA